MMSSSYRWRGTRTAVVPHTPQTWQERAALLQRKGLTLTEIAERLGVERDLVVEELYDRVVRS